ncbi:hypothetical protein H4R99_003169 [Coemansia sp. RSA 1722]|nr:hypothetical protein H4R99_003169 [Coemansia sp. RSA 1722]
MHHDLQNDTTKSSGWHMWFRLHTLDHRRVGGSRLVGTGTLAIIRAVFFVYTSAGWLLSVILDAKDGNMKGHFVYFTYLCYTGLLAYLAASLVHTVQVWRRGSPTLFVRMPKVLQLMHWLLFASALLYATIVSVMFWSLIYQSSDYTSTKRKWVNASVHGTNIVIMWADMILGAMVFCSHWSHPLLLCFLMALYLSLAYINEAVNGWFAYGFINYKVHKALEIPIILGILVGTAVIYYLLYGLQLLLDRVLPPKHITDQSGLEDDDGDEQEDNYKLVSKP